MRVDQPASNFSLYASSATHLLFNSSSSRDDVSPPLTVSASFVDHKETFSPFLLFGSFGPKSKRAASAMESERQYSLSAHRHPYKRITLPRVSNSEPPSFPTPPSANMPIHTGISDEPSLFLSTSFEAADSSLSGFISSSPVDTPSKSILSIQSTPITPTASTEKCRSKFKPSSCSTEPSTSSSSSSSSVSPSPPPSSKRPTIPGPSSTRPLQFINKSGPPTPRPKPQQPTGVYVQTHSAMQQKARKKIREEGKVKRTSNCFIMYRTYMHPIIVARYGPQNNKEISRLAGRSWRNEPESVKKIYRQQAAEEKSRHATLYPSYKYNPAKPASKDGGNTDSAKSKARCLWNKPTRLSHPAVKPPSLSVPISPLPQLHEPVGTEGDIVNPAEDESSEHDLLPQVVECDKSTPSAAHSTSTNKPSVLTERGFVVTETPLFDFRGNVNLSEKKQNSKSRIGSRPSQPNQRLPGLANPLSSEIPLASTSSTTCATPISSFTSVLQGPAVHNAPFPADLKRASGLAQAFAHQRSGSQATATSIPALTRTPVSETPSGWNNTVSQLQMSEITPQQQWSVAQPSPLPVVTSSLSAVFQDNISVSATDSTADQNWVQQPPPQPAPPFLSRLASNFVQSPQPSAPIQIPVPAVTTTSYFSGCFDSPMYTPTVSTSSSLGTNGFPWQWNANLDGTPDFGPLYTPKSLSTTPTTLSSTPVMTMHLQHSILSSSPVHNKSTFSHLPHTTVSSLEDDFAFAGFEREFSSSLISNDMFDDVTWSRPLHMLSPNIADLDQQILLSGSSSNPSLSSSSGSFYPDIAISAWTALGEPHIPYPVCISNVSSPSFSNPNRNDVNLANDNDNSNSCMNINDSNAGIDSTSSDSVDDGHVLTIASQSMPLPVSSQILPWGDEEQLKMSISYFEDIVQQQKALLSLRQQWRQQTQVVQPPTSALVPSRE